MRISIFLIGFGSVVIFTNLLIINIGAKPIPEANPFPESRPDPNAAAWPDPKALAEARADPVALPDANANPLPFAHSAPKTRYKGKYKKQYTSRTKKPKISTGGVTKNNKNIRTRKSGTNSKETNMKAAKAAETPKKTGLMHSFKSATKAGMADATGSFGTAIVQSAVENAASKFFENIDGPGSNEENEESNVEEEDKGVQEEQKTKTVTKVEESKNE